MPFLTRCRRLLFLLTLALSLPFFLSAQAGPKPITEKGLEASLRTGGLKDTELVKIIQKRGVDFFLSSDSERLLTGAGATPAVLDAVRANYRGSDAKIVNTPAPSPAPPHPTPQPAVTHPTTPTAPGVYLQRSGAWIALQRESAEYVPAGISKAFGKASGGLVKLKGDVNAEIAGTHSATTVASPAVFLVRLPVGLSAADVLLVHTHPAHDNREFKVSAETLKSKDSIAYRLVNLAGSNLQIEISQGAGDYAFVDSNSQPSRTEDDHKTFLYTFQITP